LPQTDTSSPDALKPARDRPVFIHISKNAGTSLVASAGDRIVSAGHRTAEAWVAEHGRGAPIFAVIRNPFDRVASEYLYRKRRYESGERNPHLANLNKSFTDWVISTYRYDDFRTRSFFERTGIAYNPGNMIGDTLIWFIPQKKWLCGTDGTMLATELLRFENLSEEWPAFAARHGFDAPLQHRNASRSGRTGEADYTPEIRAIIRDYFREDFDFFGYPS